MGRVVRGCLKSQNKGQNDKLYFFQLFKQPLMYVLTGLCNLSYMNTTVFYLSSTPIANNAVP